MIVGEREKTNQPAGNDDAEAIQLPHSSVIGVRAARCS